MGYILANKLVIMSIYTHNWESVMNLNNRMLNIDWKKNEKTDKKRFFHKKKTFFIEIKNQKIKNVFLYNTSYKLTTLSEFKHGTHRHTPHRIYICEMFTSLFRLRQLRNSVRNSRAEHRHVIVKLLNMLLCIFIYTVKLY